MKKKHRRVLNIIAALAPGLGFIVGVGSLLSCVGLTGSVNRSDAQVESTISPRGAESGTSKDPPESGWQNPELSRVLAPLFAASMAWTPSSTPVDGLPSDVDPLFAASLHRLNEYRVAAGLAPYSYDPVLTRMAMAHVNYARLNFRAGNPYMGHFELPKQSGYSKEGDEAARTSGISYGAPNPLAALEMLFRGPYHRAQFLRARETRIGAGFGIDAGTDFSIGLFVTREPDRTSGTRTTASTVPEPRFVLFPPDGSINIPTTFDVENPDPRPGFNSMEQQDRPITGYPVTISLTSSDAKRLNNAAVKIVDQDGNLVESWVTDPAHPSNERADPSIYTAGESNDWAFAGNFNSVFIMPRKPLKKGARYTVTATLQVDTEKVSLKWGFNTRQPNDWHVAPRSAQPWSQLGFALSNSTAQDTITLEPGEYTLNSNIAVSGIRIIGAGAGATRISIKPESGFTPVTIQDAVVMERLTLECPTSLIYVRSGGTLLLRDAALSGGNGTVVAFSLERGGSIVLDTVDATRFRTSYLGYALDMGKGEPPRVYAHAVKTPPDAGGLVYGPSHVEFVNGPMALPGR